VGFDKLLRPAPKLYHRWAVPETSPERKIPGVEGVIHGAEGVKALSDGLHMLIKEVVRQARQQVGKEYAAQSETRLKGVSCCPMMAAKKFGVWTFDYDLIDETSYGRYVAMRTPINLKREDYVSTLTDTAAIQRTIEQGTQAMWAQIRRDKGCEIETIRAEHAEKLEECTRTTQALSYYIDISPNYSLIIPKTVVLSIRGLGPGA
jgi:hypothetical protein